MQPEKKIQCEEIPDKIIERLPVYYRHLKQLLHQDTAYISSDELARRTGFSSSLIRKDLSFFGNFGRKSYGYDIYCLHQYISMILGFNHPKNIVIVGAGNLGQALAHNQGLTERGFILKGIFDKNPRIIGFCINGIQVMEIEKVTDFINDYQIDVAALTVPGEVAQQIATRLVDSGIKAIWNFTEVPLKLPERVIIVEQPINVGLCKISCKLMNKE